MKFAQPIASAVVLLFVAILLIALVASRQHFPVVVTQQVAQAPQASPTDATPLPTQVAITPAPTVAPTSAPSAPKKAAPTKTAAPVQQPPANQPPATLTSPLPAPPPPPPPPPVQTTPPPPPPPVCSWSISVETMSGPGTWGTLGTWTGSVNSSTSPVFVTGAYGWLHYDYTFSAACVGHATLVSAYTDGSVIYSDAIASTSTGLREANVPHNSTVDFVVTLT